jgi:hypothetical protein
VRSEQPTHPNREIVSEDISVGQTFVSRYDGLQAVALYLEPGSNQAGEVILHLRESPNAPIDLFTSELQLSEIEKPGFYTFTFPPINNSARQDYFIHVDIDGPGDFYTGKALGEAYLSGALYRNTTPEDAQISFKLFYKPELVFIGLLREGFIWLGVLVIAFFLFIVPGFAVAPIFLNGWQELLIGEKLVIAIAISLAIYPVIYLWASLFRLGLGAIISWLVPLVSIL